MSTTKRGLLYLARKKGKTVILLLLLFFVSTFVLSCFSVLYATDEVSLNMREIVGASFTVIPYAGMSESDGLTKTSDSEKYSINTEVVQKIMTMGGIKYYNGVNFSYVKGSQLAFVQGFNSPDEGSMGRIEANTYSALSSYFAEDTFELVEGRHITPEDENVIIISETLAAMSGLSVGDEISVSPAKVSVSDGVYTDAIWDTKIAAKATIIGIYSELTEQANSEYQPTAGLQSNIIFSDHRLAESLEIASPGIYKGSVSFFVGDPAELDGIVSEMKNTDLLEWDNYIIRKNDYNYEQIQSGLAAIQSLVKTLLICVCVVCTALLLLILAMRSRSRVHETGVLMSIGVRKSSIMWQFIFEVILISVLAFIASKLAVNAISSEIQARILDGLSVVSLNESEMLSGIASAEAVTYAMPIMTTAVIFASQLFVIIAAVCLSSLAIIRLNPRDILSKMS